MLHLHDLIRQAALFSNGIRERKLISALKGLREKIVDGMQKRDETEEKLRKNSTPKAFWFEQGYSATNPGAIRVAASEALRIAGRVQEWAPQVTPPQGFTDWVRNLREYAGGRGVIEAPANVIMDVVAGLLSFEEAMCMALESRAMKPPASRAEGRGGAPGGAEGADAAAAAGPAAGDDEQKARKRPISVLSPRARGFVAPAGVTSGHSKEVMLWFFPSRTTAMARATTRTV